MEIVCATRNRGKILEFRRLLSGLEVRVLSLDDIGFSKEVEETGTTFQGNAQIKARTVCDFSKKATFADDSGLEVDYLNGEPGVYSARYGGPGLDDQGRMNLILEKLEGIPYSMRSARFVCAICFSLPSGEDQFIERSCEGVIAKRPMGAGGFGYDPIFLYGTKTFGEMGEAEKDRVSHRGKAAASFLARVARYLKKGEASWN